MDSDTQPEVTVADLDAAAARLRGVAHRTPVMRSGQLNQRSGARVFLKCENFQRMGAFKFRGAFNALAQIPEARRRAGVLAFSSGNHAQAVALSARLHGAPALILMPHDAPPAKVEATKGYGAEVRVYDRFSTDREALAAEIAAERGMEIIPPFDDARIIAGAGTAAAELLEEMPAPAVVLATLGGGGLLSGTAIAAKARHPACRVIGVEPAEGDDGLRSLRAGEIIRIPPPRGLAEGALATHVGALNFRVMRRLVDDVVTVTDEEIVVAMRFLASRMKLVVEPTGALPVAALLAGKVDVAGSTVGAIISGGNVDLDRFARLIAG
ncbi:threo-3-hydroxy-L-aspartate ammonia-lyase [Sabulicella rubraurantiaca]|uniref:threo-3-hydroxy-L-aspartate ammonia-lyase n=1 Tax=Sabulicella rubraurantiaca TaxID=2811429 RepID=UPI001A95E19B|nr:threo-3-hydroxy-L-aspartate ammonia-lyase [Sabulicella rubraurantiaca]